MGLYLYRLAGAALLDGAMYEGLEIDRGVSRQAVATVLLSSLATGFGLMAWGDARWLELVGIAALALLSWFAWCVLILQVGTRIMPALHTEVDFGQLLRTTGFAAGPGLVQVFGVFDFLRPYIFGLAAIWMFVAMVVAVRHALDCSLVRAVASCAVAALLCFAVAFVAAVAVAPTLS